MKRSGDDESSAQPLLSGAKGAEVLYPLAINVLGE
jgi:hypothetical protein